MGLNLVALCTRIALTELHVEFVDKRVKNDDISSRPIGSHTSGCDVNRCQVAVCQVLTAHWTHQQFFYS